MKKLFTLCTAMLLTAMAFAQVDETFQFVDANGNVVADGSTVVVSNINDEGQMVIPLSVKNMSGDRAAVSLYETIDNKPNGTWQTCAFGNCKQLIFSGYSPKSIVDGDYNSDIQTEWIPETGGYATWEAKLQIRVFNIVPQVRLGVTTEVVGDEVIGYGPTVTVRFEYKETVMKQVLMGSYTTDAYSDIKSSSGLPRYPGTLKIGTIIPAEDMEPYANGNIVKMRVAFAISPGASTFFLAEVGKNGSIGRILFEKTLTKTMAGWNDMKLTTPIAVSDLMSGGGLMIGFSYKQVDTNDGYYYDDVCYPLSILESGHNYDILAYGLNGTSGWVSIGTGNLSAQAFVEGSFRSNAATPYNFGSVIVPFGSSVSKAIKLRNIGTEGITDIGYVVNVNGVDGEEKTLRLSKAMNEFNGETTVSIPFASSDTECTEERTITITKVNGQPNEAPNNYCSGIVASTSLKVEKRVVVEEFTGTGCGYCPRGIVGMENMREKYGDKFIGIALHQYNSNDAMYLSMSNYASLSFSGAPEALVDRAISTDPYSSAPNAVGLRLQIPTKAGIEVKGIWDDNQKKVNATATVTSLIDGIDYDIEYVLVGDGLSGTGSGWNQTNYYYDTPGSNLPKDLAPFGSGGEYGKSSVSGLKFNDVALASSYSNSKNQASPIVGAKQGESVVNSFTLTMPTKTSLLNAINKEMVYVVAMLIDDDGTIINAAKALVTNPSSCDANGDGAIDVADISFVISVMAGTETSAAADVNGDGTVDVADISSIISEMAGVSGQVSQ